MKGITCCADCARYNMKKHKCCCASDEGSPADHFYADCPLADVKEEIYAKWDNNSDDYPECTSCGYMPMFDPHIDDIYYSPYCPNCGAKMSLDEVQ